MGFFRNISPARAIGDFRAVWKNDLQYKWLFLLLACIPPAIMVTMMALDAANKSKPLPPTVQYIESWPSNRSMADILADRAQRQTIEDLQEKERREGYKAMGRVFGMDVDAIERDAKEQEAQRDSAAKSADQQGDVKAQPPVVHGAGDTDGQPAG